MHDLAEDNILQVALQEEVRRPVVDAINALEHWIAREQEDMDPMRWTQAALVIRQLETMTKANLAAAWINVKTGLSYEKRHVWRVVQVFKIYCQQRPRPRFEEAYRAVKYAHQRHKPAPAPSENGLEMRRQRCREMAAEGATIHQIAEAVGVTPSCINKYAKTEGYEITARRAGKPRRHNANRIVEQMVMDADNLTADVNLIVFGELDHARLPAWIAAFTESQARLREFILKLKGAAQ